MNYDELVSLLGSSEALLEMGCSTSKQQAISAECHHGNDERTKGQRTQMIAYGPPYCLSSRSWRGPKFPHCDPAGGYVTCLLPIPKCGYVTVEACWNFTTPQVDQTTLLPMSTLNNNEHFLSHSASDFQSSSAFLRIGSKEPRCCLAKLANWASIFISLSLSLYNVVGPSDVCWFVFPYENYSSIYPLVI